MKNVIIKHPPRADAQTIARLGALGVATVHEAQGRTGLLDHHLRPVFPEARVAGAALTVLCQPGDNLMIHAALDVAREGDVLVVATTSASVDGMFGDLLADSCRARGVRGLVIDAGVRDVADIADMAFPVWAKAICAQGTVKATAGAVNVPIVCGGTSIAPGDVIVGDRDGVVVVARTDAVRVAGLAEARRAKEADMRRRLQAGELGLDIYGLRQKLVDLGVQWIDAGHSDE